MKKNFLIIIICIICTSCGVKSDPEYKSQNNCNINNWIITYNDKKLRYKPGCGKYVINNIYFNIYDEYIILTTKNNNISDLKITLENIINKHYEEIIEVESMDVSYVIPIFDVNQYYQNEKKDD